LLERLPRERVVGSRSKILQFPIEFQSLKVPLARFIDEFFRTNPYQEAPILRGFYFTSGTQVGSPMSHVLSSMLAGFSLPGPAGRDPRAKPQSYFLTGVFKDVIFPDRNAGFHSTASLRRRLRNQLLVGGAALLVTIAVLVPAAVSYADNSDLVRDTKREVEALERSGKGDPALDTTTVSALLKRVQLLERRRDEFQVPGLWGSYTASSLYEPVRRLYVNRLRKVVDGPIRAEVAGDVRSAGNMVRMDSENFRAAYDDLKLYLMLSEPQHLNAEWAEQHLAEKWSRASVSPNGDPAELRAHAHYYVQALAREPGIAWSVEPEVVSRARGTLFGQRLEEFQYQWLLASAKDSPPVVPEQFFMGAASRFADWRKTVAVPGAYTKDGWEKIKAALYSSDGHVAVEPWVLGRASEKSADDASSERLQKIYFDRYVRAWLDFLGAIVVHTPGDLPAAIDELRALSDENGPYVRLFQAVVQNARLDMSPPMTPKGVVEKGVKKLQKRAEKMLADPTETEAGAPEVSPVEIKLSSLVKFGDAAIAASGVNQYVDQLRSLSVALGQLSESKAEPTAQFQESLAKTASVVERLLAGLDPATRAVTEPLLMNPIRGSRAGVAGTAFVALGEKWKAEVWEAYEAKIAPRYPFSETRDEVSIAEFADFFRPASGLLWKFFEQNLADRLERSGNAFRPKAAADPLPVHPLFMRCLNVAQEITDATFGTSPELNVLFDARVESSEADVKAVTFTVDGQSVAASASGRRMQWPGKAAGPRGAKLQIKGGAFADEVARGGDFGLFRLLAYGGIKPAPASGEWLATFDIPRAATVGIRPSKSIHPFSPAFFRRLKCPPVVTAGAGP
jgi:type VI secretion system protein ImpL